MPNLVMEYTQPIEERVNVQGLLQDLHQSMIDSGLFEASSVKSRALRCHTWLVGEHEDDVDFIHLTVELLSGRTEEQKRALSRDLMQLLTQNAEWVHSLTINVRDMDRECFQKVSHD
ncbi:5-carboxymethyl-2-hydroxymuconate delta-isomerase [Vibrio ishigakensis]|uniref:5-carboxymethyl-2-hydroxymuconate delta-isomerase n=1 Tax=Vibrio ishigakensis TaxID=1481914 RepID=A0A0B8NKX5_9VIBR|nr:5-carboxymethyl-2-hydroxymuconate Delta-isomerase [Vibrio ishigakensis]GAM55360.1 5-carboxymethyl-2-hydroxymuconate delta-isomerase [Vibrio ishigakensis]